MIGCQVHHRQHLLFRDLASIYRAILRIAGMVTKSGNQVTVHDDQFGLLAVMLLCMSPDTVECEGGFSTMNLTKDGFANRLTQENLHARLTVFLDNRTLNTFPWQSVHPE